MGIEVKVPALPESVSDATIADWHKKVGDKVSRDENLVDLETDKVVLEVPAPADGVIKEIKAEAGDTVNADDVLAILEEGAGGDDSGSDDDDKKESKDDKQSEDKSAKSDDKSSSKSSGDTADLPPAARRLVEENNLDVSQIKGTGRDGRITKEDVVKHMEGGSKSSGGAAPQAKDDGVKQPTGSREEERVPMSRLRKRIAERMVEAKEGSAMLTSFNEVNLRQVMKIRKQYKEAFEKKHGVRLGLMSFFVKAACEALRKHPVVNASVDGDDIVYHAFADVGIAVATERGLLVPVLRNAEDMSLAQIESAIGDFAKKARDGNIKMEDLQGGTFTITNGGVFGSLFSTPMLNPPQSAIMGMHTIKERPVVENGEVVAAPMMYLALTYDHRIVDGKDAVQFLVSIKDALEDPHRLLLDL